MKSIRRATTMTLLLATVLTLNLRADESKTDPAARWEDTIAKFEQWDRQNSWPSNAVLFVGSSSIRMWPTRTSFPDLAVINRGFGGSQISDVNYFASRIVMPYKPRVIVFYAGDNDIGAGESPEQVLADYKTFTDKVKKQLPRTKILFITIKPSGSRWDKWARMSEANSMIEEFCRSDKRLYYVDVATVLLDAEGKPDDSLFLKDRLHLNEQGYKRWNDVLAPIIKEALGPQQNPQRRR